MISHDSPLGAVSLIMRESPDVLLVDVHMPELSGPAFLDMLKKTMPGVPPVIFVSCSVEVARLQRSPRCWGAFRRPMMARPSLASSGTCC